MSPAQLAEIEARHGAATAGPWYWRGGSMHPVTLYGAATKVVMDTDRSGMHGATFRFLVNGLMHKAHRFFVPRKGLEHNAAFMSDLDHPDARFIAHSWEDVGALIAEVKRLRALAGEAIDEAAS